MNFSRVGEKKRGRRFSLKNASPYSIDAVAALACNECLDILCDLI